ncbi:hypothetical protein [Pedobacter alpinus]|uniref:hypothetical protein n=1 Tax=Pedobacter alpinus TaxID=1590643 RepID=UPI0036133A5C
MDLNIKEANKFISYHAKPQSLVEKDLILIQDLVLKYPYCQSLHFLATQAAKESAAFENKLAKAAVFTSSGEVLYQFVNHTNQFETETIELDDSLTVFETETIKEVEETNDFGQAFGVDLNRLVVSDQQAENYSVDEELIIDEDDVITDETLIEEPLAEVNAIENIEDVAEPVEEEVTIEEPLAEVNTLENIEDVAEPVEEEVNIEEPLAEVNTLENIERFTKPVEEEVTFEEPLAEENAIENIEDVAEPVEEEVNIEEPLAEENTVENIEDVAEPVEEEVNIEEPLAEVNTLENIERFTKPVEEEVTFEEPLAEENAIENIEDVAEPVEDEVTIEQPLAEENAIENIEDVAEPVEDEVVTIEEPLAEENEIENIDEPVEEEETTIEEPLTEESEIENIEDVAEPVEEEETTIEEPLTEENAIENIEDVAEPVEDDEVTIEEPLAEENAIENIEDVAEPVEDDEVTIEEPLAEENAIENIEDVAEPVEETEKSNKIDNQIKPDKSELIFDSPVASDFFAFAKREKQEPAIEPTKLDEQSKVQLANQENLSQYNDERMPYTFLWWLNKTRKEHEANTQPYSKNVVKNKEEIKTKIATDSLNQQIATNIFQLRSVEDIEQSQQKSFGFPFDFRKKESNIIEKFIKEEPQIKPPAANKIDTENKAKKSSEDSNEVVSETLAKIYVEQMLYHKALDVYKKLSLKYPEKSTYFASQIKYLELKVN